MCLREKDRLYNRRRQKAQNLVARSFEFEHAGNDAQKAGKVEMVWQSAEQT